MLFLRRVAKNLVYDRDTAHTRQVMGVNTYIVMHLLIYPAAQKKRRIGRGEETE